MENWRQFKETKSSRLDPPADGMTPIDPSAYDVHAGGEIGKPQPKGAPIKQRRQISVYPKPGSLFNTSTGEVNPEAAEELMDIIDKDKDLMMSSDDPYVDDWLERTHAAIMDAIEGMREKGQAELDELDATLDGKFQDAIEDIRAIIAARDSDDTLDMRGKIREDTVPGFDPETSQ
tara:strand:- start:8421 stop:8948 length:528 start_codon:yes stop_codon:yes gene_type:complete